MVQFHHNLHLAHHHIHMRLLLPRRCSRRCRLFLGDAHRFTRDLATHARIHREVHLAEGTRAKAVREDDVVFDGTRGLSVVVKWVPFGPGLGRGDVDAAEGYTEVSEGELGEGIGMEPAL